MGLLKTARESTAPPSFRNSNNDSKSEKQNTISAAIVLDYVDRQSDRNYTARMVRPKTKWKTTMLVSIGKGIELDVDVTRFNSEVRDHIVRTGLRNLLMDAHASATAKAYPDDYIKRSREMAEKKLASLYAGVVRTQSFGAPKAPTDPVAPGHLRLARKAIIGGPKSLQRRRQIDWPRSIGSRGNMRKSMTRNCDPRRKDRRPRKRPGRASAGKKAEPEEKKKAA